MFFPVRWLKRRWLARQPFPPEWEPLVTKHFPFEAKLPPEERARFRRHLQVFVHEKDFVGAKDLVITDEMRVVVAGAAARLARNLSLDVYDALMTIVVTTGAWERDGGTILGEAHRWGQVVLSWDSVRHGLKNPFDGHDVALHEFAHVLDLTDGRFDGTPEMATFSALHAWADVFSKQYFALQKSPTRDKVLRAYGATNEAEFFAVATEAFFEKPTQMKQKHPALYDELKRYYRADPAHSREAARASSLDDSSR
ncbi:MAG: zinc-dependent peptidase [Myxococcales bacterium]|nr:zinc-dependent peptidase [Myxococcales bacterium]